MESRITTDPAILGGKPCIRGTRLSVEFILELIASGATANEIAGTYPQVTREDVEAGVRFAAGCLRNDTIGRGLRTRRVSDSAIRQAMDWVREDVDVSLLGHNRTPAPGRSRAIKRAR